MAAIKDRFFIKPGDVDPEDGDAIDALAEQIVDKMKATAAAHGRPMQETRPHKLGTKR